jgi:two-component system, NtrC family, sensor histidine kinase KinB
MAMTWTLRRKILVGYGIALVLTIVVFAWAFVSLLHLGQASDAILRDNYKSILAAEVMINAIERQDSATLFMILGYAEEGTSIFHESEIEFLQWLGRAKDNITEEGEGKIVGEIGAGYSSYLAASSQLRLLRQSDPKESGTFYHQSVYPVFRAVRDACTRLREINERAMFNASDRAKQIAESAIGSMVVIGLVSLGIGLGFSLLLSTLIVRPVREMTRATYRLSRGDYDVFFSAPSSDELGTLSSQFQAMAGTLKTYHDLNIGQIVTEKRKSDAIIRGIDDGIVVVDADFKVTNLNPTAARALGVEIEKAQGKHFLEVVKSEQLFEYIKESSDLGESPRIDEGKNLFTLGEDDARRYYQFSVTPVRTEAGAMLGVVLLLRDVTALKQLDRLKSEFILTASHELRTPLTGIGMSIDLLKESAWAKLDDTEQKLLSGAHEDVAQLKALVSDLLDLSRIEAGKIEMEFERVWVPVIFEKAVAVLKTQADERSIQVSPHVPDGLPPVKADPNKITWVITNLITNALRYTDPGGHVRLLAEQAGPQIHISVSDDGVGIPYEYQSKIFEKFVQVGGSKGREGSGLGLAICREIVRSHGGTIWADSIPGQGSTFTFTLPTLP